MGPTNEISGKKTLRILNLDQSFCKLRYKFFRKQAQFFFTCATHSIVRLCYSNVSVRLSVRHSRYCIKTIKPILKLFRPSGSPIIEASGTPCAYTKFQGEPLNRGRSIHGGGKNWRFSKDIAVYLGNGAR